MIRSKLLPITLALCGLAFQFQGSATHAQSQPNAANAQSQTNAAKPVTLAR
jgi:hypothetical protein